MLYSATRVPYISKCQPSSCTTTTALLSTENEARSKSRRHDLDGKSGQQDNVIYQFFVHLNNNIHAVQ